MTGWALVLSLLLPTGEQHSLELGPLPACNFLISALPARQFDALIVVLRAECVRKEE